MKSQIFLLIIFALLMACIAHPVNGETNIDQRPNVIVILVDDMGVMDSSVPFLTDSSGKPVRYPLNHFYRTPNLERLAKQGVRFGNFYAMSVCSPTRISLMTGQNSARHRTTNWIAPDANNAGPFGPKNWNWQGLDRSSITLARLLQSSGYRTIHVGKAHFGPKGSSGEDPTNLGFDVNIAGSSIGQPGSYYGENNFGNSGGKISKPSSHPVPHLDKFRGSSTFLTEALTIEAKTEIDRAVRSSHPFFLHFAHYAVHAPFEADPRFAEHYASEEKPAQAKAFATLIEGMDRSVGDLLDHLEEIGIAENTLIFFLGDNGSDAPLGGPHAVACAAPLRGKKGSHYEGGVRVPFIAAWAKPNGTNPIQSQLPINVGAIQMQMAAVYDVFPTVLTQAGVAVPTSHTIEGELLNKLLTGVQDPSHQREFLMHYPHAPHRSDYFTSLRLDDWKVVYHYFPSEASEHSHYQLFELASDPFEQMNVANQNPEVLHRLMEVLIQKLDDQSALFPVGVDGNELRPEMP